MKRQLKSFVFSAVTTFALLATLTPAAVASPRTQMTNTAVVALDNRPAVQVSAPPAAGCTKMQAPNGVYWVNLADDGSISETVTSYPSGVLTVTAAFDYNCIPNKTTLTTIWSIDGQTILTNKTPLKANANSGTETWWIYNTDGSPLSDGDYGVQFYIGQNLLASGDITVGDTVNPGPNPPGPLTDMQIIGTVVDSKSNKPINGAVIDVLKPNVDITNWLLFGSNTDKVASAKTNSKGQFTLDNRISVDVGYPWLIAAKGYRPIAAPVFTITQQYASDPYTMTITLDRTQ